MQTLIYTKTLSDADDIVAVSMSYDSKDEALAAFNDMLKCLIAKGQENELLNIKVSMHKNKVLVKIEGEHHCLAIVPTRVSGYDIASVI